MRMSWLKISNLYSFMSRSQVRGLRQSPLTTHEVSVSWQTQHGDLNVIMQLCGSCFTFHVLGSDAFCIIQRSVAERVVKPATLCVRNMLCNDRWNYEAVKWLKNNSVWDDTLDVFVEILVVPSCSGVPGISCLLAVTSSHGGFLSRLSWR